MIIVVPSCLKDADGARTRSDQNVAEVSEWPTLQTNVQTPPYFPWCSNYWREGGKGPASDWPGNSWSGNFFLLDPTARVWPRSDQTFQGLPRSGKLHQLGFWAGSADYPWNCSCPPTWRWLPLTGNPPGFRLHLLLIVLKIPIRCLFVICYLSYHVHTFNYLTYTYLNIKFTCAKGKDPW